MQTRESVVRWMVLIGLVLVVSSIGGSATRAENDGLYVRQVRTLETSEIGLLHPAGLAYSPAAGEFIALKDSPGSPAELIVMTPFEDLVMSLPVNVNMNKATSMAFDARFGRLLLLEPGRNRLTAVNADVDGRPDPSPQAVTRFGVQEYGLVDPQGMAVNPGTGQLCMVDQAAQQIVCVLPDGEGDLDGKKARDEGRISQVDVQAAGIVDPTGLAPSPRDDHFYLVSAAEQRVYELTRAGQVVAFLDLLPFGLADPQGLVFAPSGDSTDDPSTVHLYLADTGLVPASVQRTASAAAEQQAPGRVVELALEPPAPLLAAPVDSATLERTTDTSLYVPPSPDPSGLAYLPDTDTLLISDGEVDEMPGLFAGANLFETTLSGSLVYTYTTLSFSDEPTGVAYDPGTDHLFLSDDNAKRVWESNLSATVLYRWFRTTTFGSNDPEGIAYDSWRGHLLVVDGTNAEIYDVGPGVNGVFDGVPPSGDDQVSHWDTAGLGITDPEGVEFDPDNGHLYIVSNSEHDLVMETAVDGTLIRYIDIASLHAVAPAGVARAPSSTNHAQMNLYIVARGVDNNEDPKENDGKLYEISFLPWNHGMNQAPSVSAGPDQAVNLPDSATLDGMVTDDGLPDPPGAVTTTWSQISGPGTATFSDASAVGTTVSFSEGGVYVLRLTADDGELDTYDELTIAANGAPVVDAGTDQEVTLPDSATLDGTVTDDGLPDPPSAVTTAWSQISGPGTATFADASAVDTTVSFSEAGVYVLRLTADDGALTAYDELTVQVLDEWVTVSQPVDPGDAPPVSFGATRVILDCSVGPGGTVTVTLHHHDYAQPPSGVNTMSKYWEIRSDFEGAFTCDLVFGYEEGDLNGATEEDIAGTARWDEGNVMWEYRGGAVDTGANTVTILGMSAFSPWLVLTSTPPQAVSDLGGTRAGSDLQLDWSAVTQDILSSGVTPDHYVVYRRADEPYFVPEAGDIVGTPTSLSFLDTGVLGDPAHNYVYVVTAVGSDGAESAGSRRLGAFDFELVPAAAPGERSYNLIAVNLELPGVVDADSLAAYVGSGVYMVMRHDAATQEIVWRLPGLAGTNFPVGVGDVVYLYLDETAPDVVSLVGGVPAVGAVSYSLTPGEPAGSCAYNFISVPLDRDDLVDADTLAADIGVVYSVSRYSADTQDLTWYMPGGPGENFPVRAGYPYIVCLDETAPPNWP